MPTRNRNVVGVRIQNCWVFSARDDLLVFVGPLLAAYAIMALLFSQGLHKVFPAPFWVFVLTSVLVDMGHVCSTLFRTYFDRDEFRRRRTLYITTPVVCFLTSLGLSWYSTQLFLQLYVYFNIYHVAKQQYGWMMYSIRREQGLSSFDRLLDKVIIFNAVGYPVLWWHLNDAGFAWRPGVSFVHLPAWLNSLTWWGHWLILVGYLARQVYLCRELERPVNLAKHLIWGSTWLVWFPAIVFSRSLLLFGLVLLLTHGVPYLLLVFRYGKKRWPAGQGWLSHLFGGTPGVVGYMAAVLLMGLAWYFSIIRLTGQTGFLGSVCLSLMLLPATVHYALDGFIWKMRDERNHDLKQIVAQD